jgi:hypothetical protein
MRSRIRIALAFTAVCAAAVVLAGCVSAEPVASPTATAAPSVSASPTPSAPPAPALKPEGSAAENLDYFTTVVTTFLSASPDAGGREIVDALVAAGFDKTAMEVTPDKTAVGLDADNIQFSVRMNGTCLIGQSGNVGVHTITATLLATGTCLVGDTRAIDW